MNTLELTIPCNTGCRYFFTGHIQEAMNLIDMSVFATCQLLPSQWHRLIQEMQGGEMWCIAYSSISIFPFTAATRSSFLSQNNCLHHPLIPLCQGDPAWVIGIGTQSKLWREARLRAIYAVQFYLHGENKGLKYRLEQEQHGAKHPRLKKKIKPVKLPGQLKKANGQLSRIFILRLDN